MAQISSLLRGPQLESGSPLYKAPPGSALKLLVLGASCVGLLLLMLIIGSKKLQSSQQKRMQSYKRLLIPHTNPPLRSVYLWCKSAAQKLLQDALSRVQRSMDASLAKGAFSKENYELMAKKLSVLEENIEAKLVKPEADIDLHKALQIGYELNSFREDSQKVASYLSLIILGPSGSRVKLVVVSAVLYNSVSESPLSKDFQRYMNEYYAPRLFDRLRFAGDKKKS